MSGRAEKADTKKKKLLSDFAVWVAARYGMPVEPQMIESEIETFLAIRDEDDAIVEKSKIKSKDEEEEHIGYLG